MNSIKQAQIREVANILHEEAGSYYDQYKHDSDAINEVYQARARRNYEKFRELNRIAAELDIIAGDNF
jgi:hypothetical protein